MDPLATVDDLIARAVGTLETEQLVRAEALLADASANVRRVSTQQFTAGTSTVILTVSRAGQARLPQRPVTAVTSVDDLFGNPVAYRLVGETLRFDLEPWNGWEIEPRRCAVEQVVVTYDHGSDTVPDLIVGITCSVVLRALGVDPMQAGITQEVIDGYSYMTGTIGAGGPLGFLPSEIEILTDYARPRGPLT